MTGEFTTPPAPPEICRPLGEVLVELFGDQAAVRFDRMVEYFRPAFSEDWVQAGHQQISDAG